MTVRTVAECDRESIVEALALARSLRAFGGSQATAPCEIHFIERLPDDLAPFERLGASVTVVERLDQRCPHANKLQMLRPVETDYLLAVDCDVVVAADFIRFLVGDAVASAIDWGDWMVPGGWAELFAAAAIPLPPQRMLTTRLWQETVHYANSGVLVVPRQHVQPLREEWSTRLGDLLDAAERRAWWGPKQRYFADQIALALTNHCGRFPTRVLPLEMNWLLKFDDLPPELCAAQRRPLLMHSIHRMDFESGHLLPHRYQGCNEAIDRYNALLDPVPEGRLEEALRVFGENDRGW
ncbi:MAG: hypothetical protein JWM24_753 [Solirubrobacterales bacterium]|nr:hypothetical protein [Solirubrobacterales bacterium]